MNEEMLKKLAGGGKSPEEVIAIAKEYGRELTLEQAKALCDKSCPTMTWRPSPGVALPTLCGKNWKKRLR